MELFVYILRITLIYVFSFLDIVMLVRALLSWFDPFHEWKISQLAVFITEPIINPVRALLFKLNWFQNSPIDVSFIITWLLLSLCEMLVTIF